MSRLGLSREVECYNEDDPRAFENYRLRDFEEIERLVEHSAASVVLFKPLMDTFLASVMMDRFADTKILFPFRHYDDAVNSMVLKACRQGEPDHHQVRVGRWISCDFSVFDPYPPSAETQQFLRDAYRSSLGAESGAALYWYCFNQFLFDLHLDASSRVMSYQYERAALDPERTVGTVCDFIGVRFKPGMVDGIHAGSVRKSPRPEVESAIREQCDALWQRLCDADGTVRASRPVRRDLGVLGELAQRVPKIVN